MTVESIITAAAAALAAAAPLHPVTNERPPTADAVPVIIEITPPPPERLPAPGLASMNAGCYR